MPKNSNGGVFHMKKALIFLADGFEEMEAVTPLDFMRRAGLDAKFVSLAGTLSVTGSHGVTYRADMLFDEKVASEADMLILPGGLPGAQNLQDNEALGKLLLKFHEEGKFVCAICAAPMVLGGLGLLKGRKATCYPGFEPKLIGANVTGEAVEVSDNVITGKGPGLVMNFGLALVAAIKNDAVAEEVAAGLLL